MGGQLRVLIAEDSREDCLLLLRELTKSGYEVISERVDSEQGMVTALDRGGWDLVIGDFNMPSFSGHTALRMLRERDSDTPFIFVSGTIGEDVAVEAMRAGAQDYVMKGNLKRLVPAIQREIREAEAKKERRQAGAALRSTELRLEQLLATSTAVVYSSGVTAGGIVPLWVSDSVVRILGYSLAEVLQPAWWLTRIHPDDRAQAVSELSHLTGDNAMSLEYRLRHKDGSYRWIHDQSRIVAGSGDYPKELVGAWLDVTERHRLENQFHQAQKMEAVGRLAGGIAHDFNNLLTIIASHTEFLQQELPAGDSKLEDLDQIHEAVDEAAGLTRQLLAFSRQQVFESKVLDVNAVVTKAERMLGRIIGEDVELTVTLEPALGQVKADQGQLTQVLMNLAVNARDAMPEGGKLTIETSNLEVDREYAASNPAAVQGSYVMVAVSDTGIGMDETTKARVFEPFFTTKDPGKGTGLGLSTVYGIVKQSGGFIWVYSEPGQGTVFKIYLPRVPSDSEIEVGPPESQNLPRGWETVLLVEDADGVRTVGRRILERQGYEVLEASNGEMALHLVAAWEGPIHLLLTDVVMPGMGGRRLAEEMIRTLPELKVLYASGYTDDAVVRHGVLESAVAYLQKPYTNETLARKVRQVLDAPLIRAPG